MSTKKRMHLVWAAEVLSLLICVGLGVFFFLHRQCPLDGTLLGVWSVLLTAGTVALVRAEKRNAQMVAKTGKKTQEEKETWNAH